ncbi:MAG TPA: heme ABC exporter ATP-binding protein CcmA [Longimicrobiales bacterium]
MNLDQAARTTDAGPLGIDLQGAARRFGSRWVLRGVELQVRAGEVVALTGRNGSGKTTLLRILATLLRPNRGTVTIFGRDAAKDPDFVRQRLGFLAHNPGIYDDLTASENLLFAQRMNGLRPDAAERAAVLDRVGLTDAAHDRARGFSAGMRRRLALGRLLLRPPLLMLLDEPYASFDADGIALVNELARETAARGGCVVIATHDLDRASIVMSRRVDVRDGLLFPVAAPDRSLQLVRGGK